MCGITGQFNYASDQPVDPETIRRMALSIRHRGPDDDGYFIDGPLGLGFRRLSIIDLSGGHQPMSDVQETVWVVFNGEIYNYLELRQELESKGHVFRTKSDTEVIVHGYKQWGLDVFKHLNGMFGIGLWDVARRRLVLSRDAMGIKLIYYKIDGGNVSFGSEIRAVRAARSESASVDPSALNLFLRFRYTPAPLTMFQGIRKLAPGSMLIFENGTCREERWYDYTPVPFDDSKSEEEAIAELLELYKGAVRRHLLADVPVGILLSGGLDSGLLLALMKNEGDRWPAYTVGYGESFAQDELRMAAESARILGARHIPVQLDQAEYERALPKIVECLEEPITSSSVVPMYFVCQRARQDVKVALIGQGPDELFGGYKRHLGVRYGGLWRELPSPVRSMVSLGVQRLPRNEMLKRGVQALGTKDRLKRYENVFSLAPGGAIDALFKPGVLPGDHGPDVAELWRPLEPQMQHLGELGGFQMLEIRSSLPEELLMFADKLSMAHSLEVRVPYLDRTVVEFAQRLGPRMLIRGKRGKWIHRKVCERYLDPRILNRPKLGFAVNVVDGWLQSSVKNALADTLRDPRSRMFTYLDYPRIQNLLGDHESGRQDNHKVLFSLVVFEQWLRMEAVKS